MPHCNHNECEHELRYCKCCDTVYCTKCKREWPEQTYIYPTYTPTMITTGAIFCEHK